MGWSRIQKKPEGLGFRDLGFWGELVDGRQKGPKTPKPHQLEILFELFFIIKKKECIQLWFQMKTNQFGINLFQRIQNKICKHIYLQKDKIKIY